MISLDSSLLDRACAVARTQWLHQLLAEYLPDLMGLSDSKEDLEIAQQWDSLLKQKFVERGLVSPAQQKNRITDVRNAIKVIDPNHPALNVVGFTASEWVEINSIASAQSTNRTTQFLADPDAIATQAQQLLQSRIWSEVAAGLAVVTGRRVSEVLKTAEFTFKSAYSVIFTGAVKRRDESVPLTFEIPTLVPANTVIDAIASLRGWLDTNDMTNRQINDRYEQTVAQMCDRHFRDLVPLRDGKGNLYTHLFRAVYATLATHWFCPPTVSDLEFRAYIQGHFQILHETNQQKRTSMAAQRHYWDYKIADGQGNVDGRLGIKLQETEVQVLEAFERPQTTTKIQDLGHKVHLRVFHDDRSHLASIQSQFDLNSRAEAFHFVLELAQSLLSTAELIDLTPKQLRGKLTDLTSDSNLLSVPKVEKKAQAEELKLNDAECVREQAPDFNSGERTDNLLDPSINEDRQQLSIDLNQNELEPTTTNESDPDLVNQTNAVDSIAEDIHPQTEELSPQNPPTPTTSAALIERMDRQQESLSSLTDAIHGLVKVLANSPHPSSTNSATKEATPAETERDCTPRTSKADRSSHLVPPTVKYTSQSSSETKTSSTSSSSDTTTKMSRKRRSELSRQKVNQYIDRIMAYNDVLNRPHSDKWLITIAALKRLTHCGQSIIYDVLRERASDIQFHHDKHQLGQYHNQKGKNAPLIESVIS